MQVNFPNQCMFACLRGTPPNLQFLPLIPQPNDDQSSSNNITLLPIDPHNDHKTHKTH